MTKFEYPRLWPFAAMLVLAGGLWLYDALEPARMASTVLWHSPKYERGNGQVQQPIAYVWPSGIVTWQDDHRPVMISRDYYLRLRKTGGTTTIPDISSLPSIDPRLVQGIDIYESILWERMK